MSHLQGCCGDLYRIGQREHLVQACQQSLDRALELTSGAGDLLTRTTSVGSNGATANPLPVKTSSCAETFDGSVVFRSFGRCRCLSSKRHGC